MRLPALFCLVSLTIVTMSCGESGPAGPTDSASARVSTFETGVISVFVHWDGEGIAGKRVEILELGRERTTNGNGIATFRVRPGGYTVRVYDINRGGPAMQYVDTKVTVTAREGVSVEVVDCLPCV
jgi:hypothetical protein